MVREFGSVDRVTEDNDARARRLILEIAKWPEQEAVWETERSDEAGHDDEAGRHDLKPEELEREYARWADARREDVSREDAGSEAQSEEAKFERSESKRKAAKLDETWRLFKPEDIGLDKAWRDQVKFRRDELAPDVRSDESDVKRADVKSDPVSREDESLVRFFGPGREEPAVVKPSTYDSGAASASFHVGTQGQDEEKPNSTALIAGGAIAGLLIVGAGIYAYQFFSAHWP